jgi:hypothetical protein
MYKIHSVHEKNLEDLVIDYLNIKTELGIFSSSDLPIDVQRSIDNLADKLEIYYGKDNLHSEF